MTLNWNWDEIKVSNITLLPDGVYETTIISAEEKPTMKGGKYWRLGFQVSKGEHLGTAVFSNFNIENANPDTEKWARSDIKAIAMQNGRDSAIDGYHDLISMSCNIKVTTSESDKYGEQNDVRIMRQRSKKVSPNNFETDKLPDFKNEDIPF